MVDTDIFTSSETGQSVHWFVVMDVSYIYEDASNIRSNILRKLQMILDVDGTVTRKTLENLIGKNTGHTGFLHDVSFTLIRKTNGSDSKKLEDY